MAEIKNGELIYINFTYMEKEHEIGVEMHSKIAGYVILPAILDENVPLFPEQLENVKLVYKTECGFYEFTDFQIELKTLDNKYIYCIKCNQNVKKNNRRENFRVFIGEYVNAIHYFNNQEENFNALLKDISITGMGIVSSYNMEIGDKVSTLYQSDYYKITLLGTITRKEEIPNKRSILYGVKFDERTEVLSKTIMKRQLENRLKLSSKRKI